VGKATGWLAGSNWLRSITPGWIKRLAREKFSVTGYDRAVWAQANPWVGGPDEWEYDGGSRRRVGILFSHAHDHQQYMTACHDLCVSYRVVDVRRHDWMTLVRESGCSAFLAWPSTHLGIWKALYDERVRIMTEELALTVIPGEKEIWLYESKWRTADWLQANDLPHPRTWVFFEERDALDFLARAPLPLVAKADRGATSHGVVICRNRRAATRLVRSCFGKGYVPIRGDKYDPQRGMVLFQEYLPDVNEWRMVRIGDSFICRFKERRGDFHSGSGLVKWARPVTALLDLVWEVTERGGFRSMNVDVFETGDGRLLVNELHAVFGGIREENLERGREDMGRWLRTPEGRWRFEPGFFYANACANLRVELILGHAAASSATAS